MQNISVDMDTHVIEGEEVIQKEVKAFGSGSAHIIAPKRWRGCKVKLVRTTPIQEDDEE